MKRQPVGITTAPISNSNLAEIVVVCNDGTVWVWRRNTTSWEELPRIPGTEKQQVKFG